MNSPTYTQLPRDHNNAYIKYLHILTERGHIGIGSAFLVVVLIRQRHAGSEVRVHCIRLRKHSASKFVSMCDDRKYSITRKMATLLFPCCIYCSKCIV